jgi:prepilin-type processing-associated H-X9-DG protein
MGQSPENIWAIDCIPVSGEFEPGPFGPPGVIVSSVQSAREAARRSRCVNDHYYASKGTTTIVRGYTIFNTIVTPNSTTHPWSVCKWGTSGAAQQSEHVKADSYHPGGVAVLFADGSVKFIKDSVSVNTWMALGTRDNGEVISADSD